MKTQITFIIAQFIFHNYNLNIISSERNSRSRPKSNW